MREPVRHLIRGAGRIFDIFPPPMPNPSPSARMEAIWKETGDLLHGAIAQFADENGLPSPEEIRDGKAVGQNVPARRRGNRSRTFSRHSGGASSDGAGRRP